MQAIPEVGQTVLVRGRPYLVEDCQSQAIQNVKPQHLVSLSCLDENALDEKMRVVWELEAGAEIRETSSLPNMENFDDPGDLDAFLNAVRWGIVSQLDANSMQSPFRSGIVPEDYQLEPVAKALTMPRVNLLLADDVGLGKTIEAGLTMQELMLRNRVNTVLIVCPAGLQYQWREEMRDKFGLEFRIINSAAMAYLRRQRGIHVNPWTHFPRLITSIDYFKQDRVFQRFRETLPPEGQSAWPRRYDLLIVDEAHNIAPAGSLHYARPSLRTNVIRQIAPHFEHRIFLTATPHNGYRESFSALLEILDNQRFLRGVQPSPETLSRVMIRRMKSEITNFDGTPRFPERHIESIEVDYDLEERRAHALFKRYTELCLKRYAKGAASFAIHFVLKLLKKRLFSSPLAFARTLERHIEKRRLNDFSKRVSFSLSLPDLDDLPDEEEEETLDSALLQCASALGEPDMEEMRILMDLRGWAQKACRKKDAKMDRLLHWLNKTLRPGGTWNKERVVIFTEYVDSQNYIAELLIKAGLGGERLICLNGMVNSKDREKAKAAFQADPDTSPVRILLGTDAASEGINLQNHCSRLIHYEIPWNPSRLEQRNGRIDRHGQMAARVDIHHFVATGYDREKGRGDDLSADLEFLQRVIFKVNNIRLDLGKVGPVISSQVEKAMLSGADSPRVLEIGTAQQDAEAARKVLKLDRDLRRILEDVHNKLEDTRQSLMLTPEHVKKTVEIALRLARQPALEVVDIPGLPAGSAFALPPLVGAWATCLEGNEHPFTGKARPIVFNADYASGRDDVVLAHLNHRLVAMSLHLLRSQLWATGPAMRLNRVSCLRVPTSLLNDPVIVVTGRVIVIGATNQRVFEEMIMAAGRVRDLRFSRMGVQELEVLWQAVQNLPKRRASPAMEQRLRDNVWPKVKDAVIHALEARGNERLKTLATRLARKAGEEVKRFSDVMDEMKAMLEVRLADMRTAKQLSLPGFDTEEMAAFKADESVLRARLSQIEGEKKTECAHLRARFENPRSTLFPLAVQWLIPDSHFKGGE